MTKHPSILTLKVPKTKLPVRNWLETAQKTSGLTYYQILWQYTYYAFKNQLTLQDYFDYGIYQTSLSRTQKNEFLGHKAIQKLVLKTLKRRGLKLTNVIENKLSFDTFALKNDLTPPTTLACYGCPTPNENVTQLKTQSDLIAFLSSTKNHPLFGKPETGWRAVGSFGTKSVNVQNGTLTLTNDRTIDIAAIVDEITANFSHGYVFQTHLTSLQEIQNVFGDLPLVFRIVTLKKYKAAPKLIHIGFKATYGKSMSSSPFGGKRISGAYNLDTGRPMAVFQGKFTDFRELKNHPISGKSMLDFRIPDLQTLKSKLCVAHNNLGEYPILGWDVVFTKNGPVVLEMNARPMCDNLQFRLREGILGPSYASAFNEH